MYAALVVCRNEEEFRKVCKKILIHLRILQEVSGRENCFLGGVRVCQSVCVCVMVASSVM